MNSLLDVPAIRQHAARLSVDDYHRLGELPVELLRGNLIAKMSKSPLPTAVSDDLREILSRQLTPDLVLRSEGPLTFSDSEPEPDLAIVKGDRAAFRRSHPGTAELVIEVAVSSLEIDRVKALIYAEAGVPEYWIVCPVEKCVEVHRQPGPQGYAERFHAGPGGVLESTAVPGVKVSLTDLLG